LTIQLSPNNPNHSKIHYLVRTTFNVPSVTRDDFSADFKGINLSRRCVASNGKQIADSTEMAGMFAEYQSRCQQTKIKAGSEPMLLAVKI